MPIGRKKPRGGSWKDPRLALGLLLVIAAIALTAWTIKVSTHQDKYYVANQTIAPGTPLPGQVLSQIDANLGKSGVHYMKVGQLPRGAVASQSLSAGQFVLRSAVTTKSLDLRTLVIEPATALPPNMHAGEQIELWQLPAKNSQDTTQAEAISTGAVLGETVKTDASLSARGSYTVEVRVPSDDVPRVLQAIGQGLPLVVVPEKK